MPSAVAYRAAGPLPLCWRNRFFRLGLKYHTASRAGVSDVGTGLEVKVVRGACCSTWLIVTHPLGRDREKGPIATEGIGQFSGEITNSPAVPPWQPGG
jgi:hypothetical protein